MAFTESQQPNPLAATVFEVLDATSTIETLDASGGTLYQVFIDNTLNPNFPCFLKLYSGPLGTDDPRKLDDTSTAGSITGSYRMYVGGATVATATVVCHADVATDEQIILTSADGTTKTYVAKTANDFTATNPEFNAGGTANATASNLKDAIENSNGHNGEIVVARTDATLTLTQATKGTSGNTTITSTFNSNATVDGSFSGGTDDAFTVSGLAEPSFIFPCSAGSTAEYQFPSGLPYSDKLYACVVSTPGKAGTVTMANTVAYRVSVTSS